MASYRNKNTSQHSRLLKSVNPAAGNTLALKWADERLHNLNLHIAVQEMKIERYAVLHEQYRAFIQAQQSPKVAIEKIALHRQHGAKTLASTFDALVLLKREREDFINDPLWDELGRKPKAEIIAPIATPAMVETFRLEP